MARKGKEKAVEESSATSHAETTSSDCLPPMFMTLAPVEAHSGELGAVSVDSDKNLQDAASKDFNSSALIQSLIASLPVPQLIRTPEFKVAYDSLMKVIELTDAHSIDPAAAENVSPGFKLAVVRCCPSEDVICVAAYYTIAELVARYSYHLQDSQSKTLAIDISTGAKNHYEEIKKLETRISTQDSALFHQSVIQCQMERSVKKIDEQIRDQKDTITEKKAQVVGKAAECNRLKEELHTTRHDLSVVEKDNDLLRREKKQAEAKTRIREDVIKKRDRQMDMTGTKELVKQVTELQNVIKEGDRTLMVERDWEDEKKRLETSNGKLQKALAAKKEDIDTLKAELAKVEEKHKSTKQELQKEWRQLKADGKGKGKGRKK